MKQATVFVFCLVGLFSGITAQRFGGNKPGEKWKQVNQDMVRVIFPGALDSTATRVATLSAILHRQTAYTIGEKQRKINIVLQPFTTVSNAYVGLGPYRSEFFMTPLQNSFELGSLSWADNLAIHEYRHVQQYDNFNVGLSRFIALLFGEQGQALANALVIPNWFWEGDAVFQETLVSDQGRGRLPFFYNDFRALWQADKNYSWMKLRNGSLRHFTPDHYRLGYLQVAYGRLAYGDDFWKKVTGDAASYKGVIYPFQRAIKKHSGKKFPAFRTAAFEYFKKGYTDTLLPPSKKNEPVVDREFPCYTEEGNLLYVKSGFRQVPVFVEGKNGVERKIRVRDLSLDNQFSYKNGKIVYASYRPHERWSWNDYSELQVLEVATGKQRTITRKTKFFSPDISESGKSIVAVQVNPDGNSVLCILQTEHGTIQKQLPNTNHFFYTYPKWVNEQCVVAAVRSADGQMALIKINVGDGQAEQLTPFSLRVIGFPFVAKDTVYFTASDGGNDRLFAVDLVTRKLYQVALAEKGMGIYQPALLKEKMVYTTFTANGFLISQQSIHAFTWKELTTEEWNRLQYKHMAPYEKEGSRNLLSAVSTRSTGISKYPKSFRLFNFHSINPLVSDPEYSVTVIGENVLNTLQSELFFTYNRNEGSKQTGFNAVYGQWFPYLTLGANITFDRNELLTNNARVFWNETQLIAGLSIPLNLSKGRSITRLNAGSYYIYNQPKYRGKYKDSVLSGLFGYINNSITFSHQIQQARQHIFPRLAQTVSISYRNSITGRSGYQFNAAASLYFPGMAVNHNLVIDLALGRKDSLREVSFSNTFPFSRGYSAQNLFRMRKWGVNYHLPLCYPDRGLANIAYLLRLRANAFFDYTVGNVTFRNNQTGQLFRRNTDFRSAGAELFFDTKWWNELPLSIGVRYSRLLNPDLFGNSGSNRFEVILPVNLLQR